ncbi:pentapeptide repeat-containing protein [Flavobacterium sp.]|uniref:pentapeptide repeat-containing protein n=1 Tax=Flavobacterium sp. TaxID=239 RepID=UPI0039E5E109
MESKDIIEQYQKEQRYFSGLDLDNGNFEGQHLEGIVFENCFLYSSFSRANLSGAKFINGNLKTCDFREADLTDAHFENVSVENALFAGAKKDGTYFNNNWCYGQPVTQNDFDNWKD